MNKSASFSNFLVVIPARAGSKGIPHKNIKKLNNKPLLNYTISTAKSIFNISQICLSTDSEEIAVIAKKEGLEVPFIRPKKLSTDDATTESVLLHAIKFFRVQGVSYEGVILLQPTSPFRRKQDIIKAIEMFNSDLDMVVSVHETKSNPYYVLFEENEDGYLKKVKDANFTRRQDCPPVYEFNGSVYVINYQSLQKKGMNNFDRIRKIEIPKIYSLDIDDDLDWKWAEFILEKGLITP